MHATFGNVLLSYLHFQMEIAQELNVNENSVEVNDIKCGSVNVTLMIYNVTDSNLERKLVKVTFKRFNIRFTNMTRRFSYFTFN